MFLTTKHIKNIIILHRKLILLIIVISLSVDAFSNTTDTIPSDSVLDVVKITRSWVLPGTLRGISAIDFTGSGKVACLQAEIGSIFIFNLETNIIDREIPFGPPGDYQGLVLVNNTAWIACADGRILEMEHFASDSPRVTEHGTHLTVAENMNGLCYDKKNKRLLVSIKGTEDANQYYKGIYAFNLTQKRMLVKPVIRIDLRNRVFSGLQPRIMQTVFQPSDLDIHPQTGQLYIVDGSRRQLLRMRLSESIRNLYELNKNNFFQPEGITFTPSGELFLASKGDKDEPGMLLRVQIK